MQSLWMLAASFFFALMGMFIKLAGTQHNLGEIVFFRGVPSVLAIGFFALYHHYPLLGDQLKTHARRNISGVTSMWLGAYSTTLLPLGTASTLKYTSPLFIAAALLFQSYYPGILRQQWLRFGALGLGFIGVLLICNPFVDNGLHSGALFAALMSGLMGATAYLTVRSLGKLGEPEWRTVLLFSTSVLLTGAVGVGLLGISSYTWTSFGYLMGIGLSGLFGQLCMTRAFSRGSATLAATLQYSGIIFSAMLGYWIWLETVDTIGFMGISLVIISGLAATWYVRNLSSAPNTSKR